MTTSFPVRLQYRKDKTPYKTPSMHVDIWIGDGKTASLQSYFSRRNMEFGTYGLHILNRRTKAIRRNSLASLYARTCGIEKKDAIGLAVQRDTATCEICGSSRRIDLDHNHKTGNARGFLCHGCNVGIGFFEESRERLMRAAEYLGRN